jgi:hypothetical protein
VALDTSSDAGTMSYVTAPGNEVAMMGSTYAMNERSVVLLIAR